MDSSRVEPLGQALLDSIGPRLTGSPGMLAASDWAIAQYTSWGIEAKRENYGTWRGWRRGVSHIDLVAPRTRSLDGTMLAWSPGTKGKPVKARGKIVLLSPESKARMDTLVAQTQQDWTVMTGANGHPDSTKLYRGTGYGMGLGTGTLGLRLEKAGVVGMITSRNKLSGFANPFAAQNAGGGGRGGAGGAGGWGVTEVFETYNTTAPAVGLTCEDYSLVYRLAENNTIAMIKGSEKPDEYVMLSAHFDSADGDGSDAHLEEGVKRDACSRCRVQGSPTSGVT